MTMILFRFIAYSLMVTVNFKCLVVCDTNSTDVSNDPLIPVNSTPSNVDAGDSLDEPAPTPAPNVTTQEPDIPNPEPDAPTPGSEVTTEDPGAITPSPDVPIPDAPTPVPVTPTPIPDTPDLEPEIPPPDPEDPTPAPESPPTSPSANTTLPDEPEGATTLPDQDQTGAGMENTTSPAVNSTAPTESPILPTSPTTENGTEDSISVTSPTPTPSMTSYIDETSFSGGMNGWDFLGMWGKYNLADLDVHLRPVPVMSSSKDNAVILTMDAKEPYLEKEFPSLLEGSISFTSFVNCSKNTSVQGEVLVKEKSEPFFDLSSELEDVKLHWFTMTYPISEQKSPFKIKLKYKSGGSRCVWAVDIITVRGTMLNGTSAIPEVPIISPPESTTKSNLTTVTPKPETTNQSTTANSTVPPDYQNATSTTTPLPDITVNQTTTTNSTIPPVDISNTTNSSIVNETTTQNTTALPVVNPEPSGATAEEVVDPTTTKPLPESVKEMAQIATAMWDAFYVFLALFCACIIALIILIVRQRRSGELSEPRVETYSPRASTYQLEKSRDNTAYQTDTV